MGVTAAEATFFISDTSVTCRVASGAGPALGVTITVGTDCGWDTDCGKGVFTSNLCGPAHQLCDGPLSIPKGGHADGLQHRAQSSHKLATFSYRAPSVRAALPALPRHFPWAVRANGTNNSGDTLVRQQRAQCGGGGGGGGGNGSAGIRTNGTLPAPNQWYTNGMCAVAPERQYSRYSLC